MVLGGFRSFHVLVTTSATQHVSQHNVNKPALNLKKKHQKLYLFKRTDQYSGQEISLKIA